MKNERFFFPLVLIEGLFFAGMVATTESFALLFFHAKVGDTVKLGLLSTLPVFIGALGQLIFPKLLKERHLPRYIAIFMFLQIIGLMAIAFSGRNLSFGILLIGSILYWFGGQNVAPLWLDWFGKKAPIQNFQNKLASRNLIITIVTALIFAISSPFLSNLDNFFYVFCIGLGARILSFAIQLLLFKMYKSPTNSIEIEYNLPEDNSPMEKDEGPLKSELITFFWLNALFRFAVNFCSPFFLPYMISELKFTPAMYVVMSCIPLFGRMVFLHNWANSGKGLRAFWGIQIAAIAISFLPILWNFGSSLIYLGFLQILSGALWAGMEICTLLIVQNFYRGESRVLMGKQFSLATFFSVLGALAGGYLLKIRPNSYDLVFSVSTWARLGIAVLMVMYARKHQGIRLTAHNTRVFLYSILTIRPSMANAGRLLTSARKVLQRQI